MERNIWIQFNYTNQLAASWSDQWERNTSPSTISPSNTIHWCQQNSAVIQSDWSDDRYDCISDCNIDLRSFEFGAWDHSDIPTEVELSAWSQPLCVMVVIHFVASNGDAGFLQRQCNRCQFLSSFDNGFPVLVQFAAVFATIRSSTVLCIDVGLSCTGKNSHYRLASTWWCFWKYCKRWWKCWWSFPS